ncbi:hypothetical protein EDB86DRAFT_3070863 [Lactarius hatsudake]|nr:hypothetical protein EDB86DRAFT_3070863 [Lactarius hatsudake]
MSSHASSPMEDNDNNPLYWAFIRHDYDLSAHIHDPQYTIDAFHTFLTNTTPAFPQGIPHALGLHIAPVPLHEALTSQAKLIRALTAEVHGLAAIVHECLPPPQHQLLPHPPLSNPLPSPPPPPKPPMAKPPTPPKAQTPVKGPTKPSAQTPSFASTAKIPTRPSLILSPAPGSSPSLAVHKTPSEICSHLNGVLSDLCPGSSLSAAQWMKNNNLVIVTGLDTTSHHLQKATPVLTKAVTHFITTNPSQPVPISSKENVCLSRLHINNIPTGVSPSCRAYSPSECQDTLAHDNPAYQTLHLTRLPSWVKHPNSYAAGSSSSLVLSFEDLTGNTLQTLLAQKRLYAFRQAGDL